ncbi:MAG: septation protein A [Alphaproteobacteria bacterium]
MTDTQRTLPPLAKLALDLGPLVLFFVVNGRSGIMAATAVFMVAITVALGITYAIERKLAPMPLVTGVFVLIFGSLTLALDNELFIKLKPTIVNLLFAGILIAGLMMDRPLMKFLFQDAFHLTDEGWRKLTIRWTAFFVFLAVLNEIIWRNFSTDFWVAFKVWGNIPITVIFGLAQIPLLTRYRPAAEET